MAGGAEDVVDDVEAQHLEIAEEAPDHGHSAVETVEALKVRGPGEIAQVETDVLELQVGPHEDEGLPVGQALEELLPFAEPDEYVDDLLGVRPVEDLEEAEGPLGVG